jgi:uncharacterized protein (TIGR01777 family)
MKIFVTGGTGFVGRQLTRKLISEGHAVTILSRRVPAERGGVRGITYVTGDPTQEGAWQESVANHDAVINLAGASIFTRWTSSARKRIRESRILTTTHLVNALHDLHGNKVLFLSTSAVGYYGFNEEGELDETAPPGEGFLAALSQDWEAAALRADKRVVQVALMRFGIVLGRDGGALSMMRPLYKWHLASPLGKGRQWLSWIHEDDLVRIILAVLKNRNITGPVNCVAPVPVQNNVFTRTMAEVMGLRMILPTIPSFAVRAVLGEFSTVLLKGQKVIPKRLIDMGFAFRFPEIKVALTDLLD